MFCIWTEAAFKKLDGLYGTWRKGSNSKQGWNLPRHKMSNEAIRKVTRAPVKKIVHAEVTTNPLKNIRSMLQLNPYAAVQKKNAELVSVKNIRAKALKAAKASNKQPPVNPMAKRAAKMAKKKSVHFTEGFFSVTLNKELCEKYLMFAFDYLDS